MPSMSACSTFGGTCVALFGPHWTFVHIPSGSISPNAWGHHPSQSNFPINRLALTLMDPHQP